MADENQTPPEVNDQSTPAQLREAYDRAVARAQANEQAAGQLGALQRETAMLRAGVDLDTPLGQVFARGYDGELDPAAIKEQYQAIAPQQTPPPPPPTQETTPPQGGQPSQEEIDRQRRLEALNSGSTPPGGEPTEHPWDAGHKMFTNNRKRNIQRDRAAAPAFDHVIAAAIAGDERVIYDPSRPYSEQYDPR